MDTCVSRELPNMASITRPYNLVSYKSTLNFKRLTNRQSQTNRRCLASEAFSNHVSLGHANSKSVCLHPTNG